MGDDKKREEMGTQILKRRGPGKTGVNVDRCDAYSMTSVFDNADLVCHILKFVNVKEDRCSATLVCTEWLKLSRSISDWRSFNLTIDFAKGACIAHVGDLEYPIPASLFKDILTQHKGPDWFRPNCIVTLTETPVLTFSYANLQSLKLTYLGVLSVDEIWRDLVFNGCPQLKSMFLDLSGVESMCISVTFDYPSLEKLIIHDSGNTISCDFRCPKLVDIHLEGCRFGLDAYEMPQLRRIICHNSRLTVDFSGDEEEDDNEDEEITPDTLRFPLLESLELLNFDGADSIIVDCVRLREFTVISCETKSCTLNCPSLAKLTITDCPLLALTWTRDAPPQEDS